MRIVHLLKYFACIVGSTFSIYAILASLSLTPQTLGSSSLHNLRKLFASQPQEALRFIPRPLSPEGRRSLREYRPSGLRRT